MSALPFLPFGTGYARSWIARPFIYYTVYIHAIMTVQGKNEKIQSKLRFQSTCEFLERFHLHIGSSLQFNCGPFLAIFLGSIETKEA